MESAAQVRGRICEAQSARLDFTRFRALIASPANLSAPLVLPGRARLAISHSVGLTLGQVTVALGHQHFSHPALTAGQVWRGYTGERTNVVTVTGSPTGVLKLYIVDPFGRHKVIGTLTV